MSGLHPGVAVLAPLLGDWTGRGEGEYPTITPFGYTEDVSIGHTGRPFLTYTQRTGSPDGSPLHTETGYFRLPAPGRIELVIAQPTGIAEVDEGTVTLDDNCLSIEVRSTTVGLTASAKEVTAVERSIRVKGDELRYTLRMGAVGQPVQHHLTATLHRR